MTKLYERALLAAAALVGTLLLLDVALFQKTGLLEIYFLMPLLWLCIPILLLGMVRLWLLRRVVDERREEAHYDQSNRPSTSMFTTDEESAPLSMARSRSQFEAFALPMVAPILIVFEVLIAVRL